MAYTLQEFCADIHGILVAENNSSGREKVRTQLEKLLTNQDFIEQFCSRDKKPGVYRLNEDPTTNAVVLAHIMGDGHTSPPHDHGSSWAAYGQAVEYTDMTEWQRIDDENDAGKAKLEQTKTYRLDPGQVGLFDVGKIHSISYPDGARFVRVTGTDLDRIERKAYNLKHGTVRIIQAETAA